MSASVSSFLQELDDDVARVVLQHVAPTDNFCGVTIPDVTSWRFCDVTEMSNKDLISGTIDLLKFHGNMTEQQIMKGDAVSFASLVRFVKDNVEKAGKLMEHLQSDPDENMISAGINKLDKFGSIPIYYGISKDPRDWDEISEVSFGKMYTKLMMDKVSAEIQQEYTKIVNDKQKTR